MNGRNIINNRLVALCCIALVVLVLAACGGGDGDAPTGRPESIVDTCGPTSALRDGVCRQFAEMSSERAETPFSLDGEAVTLEIVYFRPLEDGRYPMLVFHHGSTGNGSDPSLFGQTFTSKAIARHFVERGWMVAFPQRRGRGRSGGLYDEGFEPDRSGYSCNEQLALAGAERALEDLDVITDWIRMRADVDTTRMLVGGASRGGILSVAHVARRPDVYRGAINFVGGWIAEGCGDHAAINRTLFTDAARFPGTSLWLYGSNDSFYSIPYSRAGFDAFSAAGGMGLWFELMRAPGLNGHFLVNDRVLWARTVDDYVDQL